MGIEIEQTSFNEDDHARFRLALEKNLEQLAALLADPDFGQGPGSMGADAIAVIIQLLGRSPALILNRAVLLMMYPELGNQRRVGTRILGADVTSNSAPPPDRHL